MRHDSALRLVAALSLSLLAPGGGVAAEAAPAQSTARETALALANRAADAIARGEHVQAEPLLRQAYAQYPAPTIALLHARTLVHLQRLAEAVSAYRRVTLTTLEPNAPEAFRAARRQASTELNQLLPRVPRLQVLARGGAARPSLRLSVDGKPVPPAQQGRWMLVDPGVRTVRAEHQGEATEELVAVAEGQSVVVQVEGPRPTSSLQQRLLFGALGVGAVGLGVGIASGVVATRAHSRALESCPDRQCVLGSQGAAQLQKFRDYRTVSTVGYGAGALGLGVAGYLLVRSFTDEPGLDIEVDQRGALLHWRGQL